MKNKLFSVFRVQTNQNRTLTCMHRYKRDLTPLREGFAAWNDKTPYKNTFTDYGSSILGKEFSAEFLKLQGGLKCQSTRSSSTKMATFSVFNEAPKRHYSEPLLGRATMSPGHPK